MLFKIFRESPMPDTHLINRRIVLASHPKGLPVKENFRLEEVPLNEPGEGEILLRTRYLSLDPYMRNLMEEVGPGYAPPVKPGETMAGGTVNEVVMSKLPSFQPGDLVLGAAGWQDYSLSNGSGLQKLEAITEPSHALGGLGMPGFTAYVGLLDIGQPKAGETLVVAAAAGAVGSIVGQIAKLKGLRVVGIVGDAEKCQQAIDVFGFDDCLDRKDPAFAEKLAAACPQGIDIYFENVGGDVFETVYPLLNHRARVPVCGLIAHYNEEVLPGGPNLLPSLMTQVLRKRIRVEGFVIIDHYADRFDDFQRDMNEWLSSGKIKLHEDKIHGLENAPEAFIGLLQGKNRGKLIIELDG
jgi:NADPH-dependent curcumin reductase